MRPQTLLVVLLALGCGLAAALGVRSMRSGPAAPPPVETVPAVVATVDVRRGESFSETMVELRRIPKDQAPEGLLLSVEEVIERIADYPLLKGEYVVEPKLFPKGSGVGLAAMVPPGMRAFTIQTPSFSSTLAGLIRPRDRVDILLTMEDGPNGGNSTTTTLLQQIELLAVHTTIDAPSADQAKPTETRSVTLLVTPRDAAILDLGQNKGTLHLALRNIKDEENHQALPVTMADLGLPRLAPEPEAVAVVEAPTPVTLPIRTMRGTAVGYDLITIHRPTARSGPSPVRTRQGEPQPLEPGFDPRSVAEMRPADPTVASSRAR